MEILKHNWQQEQTLHEQSEIAKALEDIELTKQAALEEFKRDEIKRLIEER